MLIAIAALVVGVTGTLASVEARWLLGFFVGSFVAGIGFGTGFQGAVRSAVGAAEPHERAGVLSALYVVAYLGMGVPAVVAGALVGRVGDVTSVVRDYGIVLVVLALGALVGLLRPAATPARATCPQVEAVQV